MLLIIERTTQDWREYTVILMVVGVGGGVTGETAVKKDH